MDEHASDPEKQDAKIRSCKLNVGISKNLKCEAQIQKSNSRLIKQEQEAQTSKQ
jgi:hypothetical protein